MTDALWLAVRGFIHVAPVAANTVFITSGDYAAATGATFVIGIIWYSNVGAAAARRGRWWAAAYAAGSAVGVLVGMSLARLASGQ